MLLVQYRLVQVDLLKYIPSRRDQMRKEQLSKHSAFGINVEFPLLYRPLLYKNRDEDGPRVAMRITVEISRER